MAMNAIELSLFSSRLTAVCEEMGAVLRRAAFSTNIKDRLDYSCAVFDVTASCVRRRRISRCTSAAWPLPCRTWWQEQHGPRAMY